MIQVPFQAFRGRKLREPGIVSAPPVSLTLVSAVYDGDGPELYLSFDRAIDIASIDAGAFVVLDPGNGYHWIGFESPMLVSPVEVSILLMRGAVYGGEETLLNAGGDNGIVAVDDGGTWGGASALVLPYP